MTTEVTDKPKGFWARQFDQNVTLEQICFDFIFGILAPILCIVLDPFVFNNTDQLLESNFYLPFAQFRIFAYLAIGTGICILALWLIFRSRLTKARIFFASSFVIGTLVALFLGIYLAPCSFIGLVIIIGILGFIPFIVAFVYWRNGVRAWEENKSAMSVKAKIIQLATSLILVLGLPPIGQWYTSRMVAENIQRVLNISEQTAAQDLQSLHNTFWCNDACYREILKEYREVRRTERRDLFAQAYLKLTGEDIEYARCKDPLDCN